VGLGLRQVGLDPGDVTIVSMAAPARIAALDSGAADAAVLVPPQDVQTEKLGGGAHRLLSLGDYVVGINGGLGATTTLLQAKPALVDGMVTAVLMAVRSLRENREGTLPLIMSYMDVDADTAAATIAVATRPATARAGAPSAQSSGSSTRSSRPRRSPGLMTYVVFSARCAFAVTRIWICGKPVRATGPT